ncbi:TapB family protein [Fulvivirga lutea]|uniref:DUF3108 domain-containing protein n=1 Tax=Fulvivirga lutea TaxID=2810512 RepID=A0A974WGJ0_9BACT|nr:hypothetical protein [Fulvivirga lutea]QSE97459.1 hypothetical protein JR347_18060 [Fulvivirga lutea]
MRTLLTLCLCLLFQFSYSQCNPFYNFKEGSTWEITNYTDKDKVTSRQVNSVKSLTETSNGWEATLAFKSYDKKDKLELENEIEMTCDDGTISMDMSRFFPQEMMESFEDMDLQIETENMVIPESLSVGDELPEASITISGQIPFTMETKITDRKVQGIESITTPAGTFECYKISYKIITKTMMSIEMNGVDWIAKDVGMVKAESYKQNGKLMGVSLLTSFE